MVCLVHGFLLIFKDCFIVDAGSSGVFAWIGKSCTVDEKKEAMANAVVKKDHCIK